MGRLSSNRFGAGRDANSRPNRRDAHLRRQMAALRVHHRYRRLLSRSVREHCLSCANSTQRVRITDRSEIFHQQASVFHLRLLLESEWENLVPPHEGMPRL